MSKKNDLTGQVFNRWTVLKEAGKNDCDRVIWTCKCECGIIRDVRADYLRRGTSKSCGCYKDEVTTIRNTKHGASKRGNTTPEYTAWHSIQSRCYNESLDCYPNYGGRGIIVCPRWIESFENFFKDMGLRPSSEHSIDRINVNGNYEPSNCRWATQEQQKRNRTDNVWGEYNGEKKVMEDWAKIFGITRSTLDWQLKKGKPFSVIAEYYKNKKTAA